MTTTQPVIAIENAERFGSQRQNGSGENSVTHCH